MNRKVLSILLILLLMLMPLSLGEEAGAASDEPAKTPAPVEAAEEEEKPTPQPEKPEKEEATPTPAPEADECAHKKTKREYGEVVEEWAVDNEDGTHTWHITQRYADICQKCGKTVDTGLEETVGKPEKHLFDETGLCEACEYQCPHEKTTRKEAGPAHKTCTDNGDGTHTWTTVTPMQEICDECAAVVSTEDEESAETAPHTFDEKGFCADCGHQCPHDGETIARDSEPVVTYTHRAGRHHNKVTTIHHATVCALCQAELEGYDEVTDVEEKHRFNRKGKCVCGIKQEKEEKEKEETRPVDPEMIETLCALGADLQGRDDAQLEILYMDELLTTAEMDALRALPMQDQLMTALCVCGFDTYVSGANRLSTEAGALFGDIRTRLYQMHNEEWFAFQKTLDSRFPEAVITIGGKTYEAFTLDLKVTENGLERVDRYSFRLEDDTWRLTQKP